jgi:hypothetical protein
MDAFIAQFRPNLILSKTTPLIAFFHHKKMLRGKMICEFCIKSFESEGE